MGREHIKMTEYQQYEAEKRKLKNLTPKEYERAIRLICKKFKV